MSDYINSMTSTRARIEREYDAANPYATGEQRYADVESELAKRAQRINIELAVQNRWIVRGRTGETDVTGIALGVTTWAASGLMVKIGFTDAQGNYMGDYTHVPAGTVSTDI